MGKLRGKVAAESMGDMEPIIFFLICKRWFYSATHPKEQDHILSLKLSL